jgi:hypothetical protein
VNFQAVRDFRFEPVSHSYLRRDGMLYAPGLGYGSDPLAPEQLDVVCERSRVIPLNLRRLPCDFPRNQRTRQRPLNRGFRRFRNASTPSLWSSVRLASAN